MITLTTSTKQVRRMFKDLEDLPRDVMKPAYKFLKKKTPIDSGNARNKTVLRKDTIKSGYDYAGRLDEGWSQQAPKGFTGPTIDEIDRLVDKEIRRLTR